MKVTVIYCFAQKESLEIPCASKAGYKNGDLVVFLNQDNKEEAGRVVDMEHDSSDEDRVLKSGAILRKMAPRDTQITEANLSRGDSVLETARGIVEKHGLDMQLFDASYSFDGSRINFIFTAEDRVDFRELVKDLAKRFQKQIHLKQIGPRDKAKIVSGIGRCGRRLCCSSFLNKLESITMDMVRYQDLMSKGSSKLSGACGKLLCCLRYEVAEYQALREKLPPFGALVKTKSCEGRVIGVDILNQKIKLQLSERNITTCDAKDVLNVMVMEDRDESASSDGISDSFAGASDEEIILKG